MTNGKGRTHRKRKRRSYESYTTLENTLDHCSLRGWLKRNGFDDKLKPCLFKDTGRGLMTIKNLSPGDCIISVPHHVMITTETVKQNEDLYCSLKQYKEKFSAQEAVALYLILEKLKGVNSKWTFYFATLPQMFSTSSYFSAEEISLLPESVQRMAKEEQNKFLRFNRKVVEFFHTHFHDILSEELCKWAWYVVNTRCVYFKRPHSCEYFTDMDNNLALAPYLDLLNHSPFAKIETGFNEEKRTFDIKTLVKVKKYEQVFICYGDHDNRTLFVEYGFTLPVNPNNVIEMCIDELRILEDEFHIEHKEQKFSTLRHPDLFKKRPLSLSEEGLSWQLQRSLKILCMTWEELKAWRRILHDDLFCENHSDQVLDMATFLVSNMKKRNKCPLKEEETDEENVHTRIILSLWKDQEMIIESCLNILKTGNLANS